MDLAKCLVFFDNVANTKRHCGRIKTIGCDTAKSLASIMFFQSNALGQAVIGNLFTSNLKHIGTRIDSQDRGCGYPVR
eukprot:scaffold16119_cov162-Amphora_coffeaeformis.AAC.13